MRRLPIMEAGSTAMPGKSRAHRSCFISVKKMPIFRPSPWSKSRAPIRKVSFICTLRNTASIARIAQVSSLRAPSSLCNEAWNFYIATWVNMKLKDPLLLRESCFIDGAWVPADNGGTLTVHNPATTEKLGLIPNMGAAECRRAISSAATALPAWAARTAKDRAAALRRWFDLMLVHQEDLAVLMTAEQGKPLADSQGEIL